VKHVVEMFLGEHGVSWILDPGLWVVGPRGTGGPRQRCLPTRQPGEGSLPAAETFLRGLH
jgi:hypothetical protein